jgi:hypothetical protein
MMAICELFTWGNPMKVFNCEQRSDEWAQLRCRPTASGFGSFVTPARGDYSKQATAYAAQVVAKKLGVFEEPPPSFWMDRGIRMEPSAKLAYTKQTGREITDVGFIMPDNCSLYGGSPDGLIGTEGLIEIKCPKPEAVIAYHAAGVLPVVYKPQCQGLLLISGRPWIDFFAWHESLTPFLIRVKADEKYQQKIAEGLLLLLEEIEKIKACVKRENHEVLPDEESPQTDLKWEEGA